MSISPILFDTCAMIWATRPDGLSPAAQHALAEAERAGAPIYVSPISAWAGAPLTDGNAPLPPLPFTFRAKAVRIFSCLPLLM